VALPVRLCTADEADEQLSIVCAVRRRSRLARLAVVRVLGAKILDRFQNIYWLCLDLLIITLL
jgi:hypothetical protein